MEKITKAQVAEILAKIKLNFENAYKCGKDEMKILIDSWFDVLGEYPSEVVLKAFNRVLATAEFAPKLGTIVKEVEKIIDSCMPDVNVLWRNLADAIVKTADLRYYLNFTARQANGLTEGENARIKIQEVYNGLGYEIKHYLHDISGLYELSKLDTDQLAFEKGRFMKEIPNIRERMKLRGYVPDITAALDSADNGIKKLNNIS